MPTMQLGIPTPKMPPIVVTKRVLKSCCKNFNVSKAFRPNGIPIQALKLAAEETAIILQHIFQQTFDTGDLPLDWRRLNITTMYKKGKTKYPSNYRPVSLTFFTKIFQRIVYSEWSVIRLFSSSQ